ncbi:MAG: hypothetical protein HRU09_17330 [Oligoflexales bacterium]|nr:hypothetical protein [Oligoflexales bacterium]
MLGLFASNVQYNGNLSQNIASVAKLIPGKSSKSPVSINAENFKTTPLSGLSSLKEDFKPTQLPSYKKISKGSTSSNQVPISLLTDIFRVHTSFSHYHVYAIFLKICSFLY